jgi:levanase
MVPMNPRLLRPTKRKPSRPGAPTITSADGSTGLLVWTAPASNGGSAITAYRIYEDDFFVEEVNGNVVTWPSIAGPGTAYQVSAVNAIGEGPKSAAVVAS